MAVEVDRKMQAKRLLSQQFDVDEVCTDDGFCLRAFSRSSKGGGYKFFRKVFGQGALIDHINKKAYCPSGMADSLDEVLGKHGYTIIINSD
jgi:hypothetical protein